MLHIEVPHQGIYTPLSQGDSPSDSEEQLFLRQQQPIQSFNKKRNGNKSPTDSFPLQQFLYLNKHHQGKLLQQQQQTTCGNSQQQQQKYQTSGTTNTTSGTSSSSVDPRSYSTYTTNMQNMRSVMMSDNEPGVASNFSSFNSDYDERNHLDADNVAILGGSNSDLKNSSIMLPMSPARRCCFAASLLLCFLVIFSFVWLAPCNEEGTCPSPLDRSKTHNWLSNYTKLEFKGGINVVPGSRRWESNLIFLYRGDLFFPEFRPDHTKKNGIISLIGSSGSVAWYEEMMHEPILIDCSLIDVDRNGQYDCLVMDEYGKLGAINPSTGHWHWTFNEHSMLQVTAIDFPVILPDLDGDGVFDVLMVTDMSLEERAKNYARKGDGLRHGHHGIGRNYLRMVSGRTGTSIGEGFELNECEFVRKMQLEEPQTITYTCFKNNTEARRSKKVAELFALITNKSLMSSQAAGTTASSSSAAAFNDITQYHRLGRHGNAFDSTQRNIYSLSGRELVIENRGKCQTLPDDCNVTFILSDGRNGKVKVLRNFTTVGMYGMEPVQWHFKNSKPEMSGFVMKFWKWKESKTEKAEKENKGAVKDSSSSQKSSAKTPTTPKTTKPFLTLTPPMPSHPSLYPYPSTSTLTAALGKEAVGLQKPVSAGTKKAKANMIKDGKDNHKPSKASYESPNHNPALKIFNEKIDNKSPSTNSYTKTDRDRKTQEPKGMHPLEQIPESPLQFHEFSHFVEKRQDHASPTMTARATNAAATATSAQSKQHKRTKQTGSKVAGNKGDSKERRNAHNLFLDNYRMQMVTESVILIIFIGADTRIENTSQSNIIQFCGNMQKTVVCQPDLYNQENSMLISDIDQDGYQELISYMSTFMEANDDSLDYKLVTYARLLRLQSELPAFYAGSKQKLI